MNSNHPISDILTDWYLKNKRDLPWRNTADPYKIWLSEIILQQTQVIQGTSYYLKFINEFPDVVKLADAPDDKIMLFWQGLGYYSRARNLLTAARFIRDNYGGKFPANYNQIKELKGVGDYTAAAISSIAFNLPHAVVDGNVYRVLSRLFNIHTPINSSEGKKVFQRLADELLNTKNAGLHNSAMMEFGALFCKPQNPNCEMCVLKYYCLAFQNNQVNILPVKNKTIKIKERFLYYFIVNYKDKIYLQKRTQKDIWQNLYQFLLVEELSEIPNDKALLLFQSLYQVSKFNVLNIAKQPKHILSHQYIFSTIFEVEVLKPLKVKDNIESIFRKDIDRYGFPQLLVKYIKGK